MTKALIRVLLVPGELAHRLYDRRRAIDATDYAHPGDSIQKCSARLIRAVNVSWFMLCSQLLALELLSTSPRDVFALHAGVE